MQRKSKKTTVRWAAFGKPTGWKHTDPMDKRRRITLKSRDGDALAAYHALDQLAKVSANLSVARKARADAEYFRKLHNKTGK